MMAVWPVTPLPPVRLTTLTGCPNSFSRPAARMRETRSAPPPAAQGTIKVMGRSGYFWAAAGPPSAMAKATALNAAVSKRRESMGISSDIFWSGAAKSTSNPASILRLARVISDLPMPIGSCSRHWPRACP